MSSSSLGLFVFRMEGLLFIWNLGTIQNNNKPENNLSLRCQHDLRGKDICKFLKVPSYPNICCWKTCLQFCRSRNSLEERLLLTSSLLSDFYSVLSDWEFHPRSLRGGEIETVVWFHCQEQHCHHLNKLWGAWGNHLSISSSPSHQKQGQLFNQELAWETKLVCTFNWNSLNSLNSALDTTWLLFPESDSDPSGLWLRDCWPRWPFSEERGGGLNCPVIEDWGPLSFKGLLMASVWVVLGWDEIGNGLLETILFLSVFMVGSLGLRSGRWNRLNVGRLK